jgi:voltage-gated potassium channel
MTVSIPLPQPPPEALTEIDEIETIQNRVRRWRLVDCPETTLAQMKTALSKEMAKLAAKMTEANELFENYIAMGNPSGAMNVQEQIEGLTTEWKREKKHLQEIDEALLEKALRKRLSQVLGGERNLNIFDGTVLFLIIIVVSIIVVELMVPLPAATIETLLWIDTIICFFLLGEFFLRLAVAPDRRWFLRRYWIDFVSSLPFNGILQFGRLARVARFARLLRLMRLGRAMRVLLFAFRGLDKLVRTFELGLLKRSVFIALALLVFGALSIAALEGTPQVESFGDSLWWSFATIVTGGFADLYNPVTPTGRLVTVGLILLGLTVTGIFTASLTSVLVEDDSNRLELRQLQFNHSLQEIDHKLDLLTGETREAVVALERVAQVVSHQALEQSLPQTLTNSLTKDFYCLQASIHIFDPEQKTLHRLALSGLGEVAPPETLALNEGFTGRVMAELTQADLATIDLEPHQELCLAVQGVSLVCPMVAGGELFGCLHVVLPSNLANDYLYTRVPMTLAHQTAMAYLAKNHTNGTFDTNGPAGYH